ncbi:MAG: copper chaperone [Vicingaceae bacterium]|nr:MAG: copper chaperone [Vicingaceae bacterium]
MKKTRLKIEGMSCQHCVNSVKRTLESLNGVEHVDVSLEKNEANVEYDEQKTNPDMLVKSINDTEIYKAYII